MSQENLNLHLYAIAKRGMLDWFLYSVEDGSFGKRIKWTRNLDDTIIFTNEAYAETFIEKVLGNIPVCLRKLPKKS